MFSIYSISFLCFSSTKLSSQFCLKDKTNKMHKCNIVYKYTCPVEDCRAEYIGETSRRLSERIVDHRGRDINSHIFRHVLTTNHPFNEDENFTVLGGQFRGHKKRKIAEALTIREKRPKLNKQEQSFPLKLFI